MKTTAKKMGDVIVLECISKFVPIPAINEFQEIIRTELGTGNKKFVVNLRDVPLISPFGVEALTAINGEIIVAGGFPLKVAEPQDTPRNLLISKGFEIFDDDQAAIESFEAARSAPAPAI